jgi:hypothetical protein
MTTTATSIVYTGADVPQGPAYVYIKAAVPSAGAAVVLHTDLSLDLTSNPSNIFMGKLDSGAEWSYVPSFFEGKSNESPNSFRQLLQQEEVKIDGSWMETQNAVKLANMIAGATSVPLTGPPASTLIQIGGLGGVPPTFSAVLVWKLPESPTKAMSVQLYKTLNMVGVKQAIDAQKIGGSPFSFKALSVDSRAAGDRLAGINIYT